ncbi:MAG TPA: TolC family protein [Acidobacteriota bacterium]
MKNKPVSFIGLSLTLLFSDVTMAQNPAQPPLTYASTYQLAQQDNLDVQAARARYAVRRAEIHIAAQRPNPLVTGEAFRDEPHASLVFELPLELGGRRARRIDVAEAGLKLADAELADALRKMRRDLRKAFYGVVLGNERIALAQTEVNTAQRVVSTAEERYRMGAVAHLEVLQAKLGLARAQNDLQLEQKQKLAVDADLRTVLNIAEGLPVSVAGSLLDFSAAFEFPGYQQAALRQNPDLQSLNRQLEVEDQRLRLLRAESYPDVSVMAGSDFLSSDFTVGPRAGIVVEIPIFKKRAGQMEQSRALQDQLKVAIQANRRRIEGALRSDYARLQAQQSRVEIFRREIIPAAEELYRLAEESYREGKSSILTVLDAQKSLRDVRLETVQAEFDFQMAIADLEEAAGVAIP